MTATFYLQKKGFELTTEVDCMQMGSKWSACLRQLAANHYMWCHYELCNGKQSVL
jgi:hypothetical protein